MLPPISVKEDTATNCAAVPFVIRPHFATQLIGDFIFCCVSSTTYILPLSIFCRLYVPLYSSKSILRSKLLLAIKTKNFGFV